MMKKTYRISMWSVVVLALLVGGLSLFALYSWSRVAQINEASTEIERNWLPSTQLLGQMEADMLSYRVAAMQHVLSLRDEDMRRYEEEMASALASLNEAQRRYEPLIVSEEERNLYGAFGSAWASHLEESRAALELSRENRNEEAITVLRQRSQPLFDEARGQLGDLTTLNVETATSISREGDDILGEFQLALVIALVLGGVLLLLVFADLFSDARKSGAGRLP